MTWLTALGGTGSAASALGSGAASAVGALSNSGSNASNQAASAGAAETQRGMQFANAPSSTPTPTALSQFSSGPANISSGTYDPMSLLERFRMYQGR